MLLGLLAVMAAAILGGEPCRGVADNLDFHRVARPAGIDTGEPPARPGRFVQCRYETGPADFSEHFSSAAWMAWVAKQLPFGAPPGTMDLRQVGLLWLASWLVLLALLVRGGLPLAVAVGLFVVVLDPGYLLFWNSFYADAPLILVLAGTVGWLRLWGEEPQRFRELPVWRWSGWVGLLLVLAFLGSGSKMQYVPFAGVVLVALAPLLVEVRGLSWRRRLVPAALLLLLTAAAGWHFFAGSGPRFPWANNYNAVYAGIAQVSAEPRQAMEALGVPEEFRDLPHRDVFSSRIPPHHPVHAHLSDLSRLHLLGLYLSEPQATAAALARTHGEMALLRTHTRGNYPRTEARPRKEVFDPPWRFGRLRATLLAPWPPLLWVLLLAGSVAVVAALVRRGPAAVRAAPYLLLLLWFGTQVWVVVLGDGFVAFEQHLLGARLALDLLLALALVEGGAAVGRWAWAGRRDDVRDGT